jgi:alkyl hydroperoxide reductase subunit AhpC/predicted Ser/Thr protein kinase
MLANMSDANAHVGSLAPDFDLPCTPRPGSGATRVKLADFRGQWLMLLFYPRDFSLVCPTELTAVSAKIEEFRRHGSEVLGVSADSVESHLRWIAAPRSQGGLEGLTFPLASDVEGAVCRAYGVFLEHQHVALRGLFMIDPNGVLQYQAVHNLSVGRRTEEMLRILAALQTGGLCAENWTPEQPTLDAPRGLGPGSVISHYRIERQIGAGAFATVFRAQDSRLERTVALKVMKANSPLASAAVLAEARAAAALNHPNVCIIYSVDDDDGVPVIAMEYLSGRSLANAIADHPLTAEEAARIVCQIATGMAAAHQCGVVHGDLKPANVFLTRQGQVKILDFGLSRRLSSATDPDATTDLEPSLLAGTPSYMAPEQADGHGASAASDVFALGSMMFEMLTGRQPFHGDSMLEILAQIREVEPESLASQLPEPFADLCLQAFAPDPARRALTMTEIVKRLGGIARQG